jgi:hypothetical protein
VIRFSLKCSHNHSFDSWFQSSEAFEKLAKAGLLTCVECGDCAVEKSLMAPKISTQTASETPALSAPMSEAERNLAKIKQEIEANSDYVGMNFAHEARAMHNGESPNRAIYGEAKAEEAKALIDEGIPVAPLPFVPKRQTN